MSVDLHIDDRLIEKAIEAGRHPAADAEVRERMKILEWVGKVDYFDDYDHKELRRRNAAGHTPG